ncbi:MAG: hypothetical protein ABEJ72_05660 [Candidatus Aenigmatarchaeota archaeon]
MSEDWHVFQRDVLDVLRQYEGFFDFFERVGSLSDDSRPDCFARVSREGKKEIWVIDAKNKPEIGDQDIGRMEKYLEMLKSNPIDIGLEMTELSDYSFRGIFITSSAGNRLEEYETISFNALHQFLQKELLYSDMDRVVRDVSKMVERKQLSQSQARLLFRSLKPFEDRVNSAIEVLEKIETDYNGLKLKKPPLSEFDYSIPVDAVLVHEERDRAILFDIPYSWEAVKEVDEKVREVKKRLDGLDKEVFYAAINTFDPVDSEFVLQPEEVEQEVMETLGIVSAEFIANLYTPKIRAEKTYTNGYIQVEDSHNLGFRLRVQTSNDTTHRVEIDLPEKASSRIKEVMMNSRKEFGDVSKGRFQQEIEVTENLEMDYGDAKENLDTFRDSVKSIYQSSVNPVLGKKVKQAV